MTEDSSWPESVRLARALTFLGRAARRYWPTCFGYVFVAADGKCSVTRVASVVAENIAVEVEFQRLEMPVLVEGSQVIGGRRATIAAKEASAVPWVSSLAQPKD